MVKRLAWCIFLWWCKISCLYHSWNDKLATGLYDQRILLWIKWKACGLTDRNPWNWYTGDDNAHNKIFHRAHHPWSLKKWLGSVGRALSCWLSMMRKWEITICRKNRCASSVLFWVYAYPFSYPMFKMVSNSRKATSWWNSIMGTFTSAFQTAPEADPPLIIYINTGQPRVGKCFAAMPVVRGNSWKLHSWTRRLGDLAQFWIHTTYVRN